MGKLCQGSSYVKGTGPCCDQPWCKVGKGKADKQQTQTSSKDKGTMLHRDGTKLNRDGTKLNRDGTTLNRDGTKLNRDGTKLNRDAPKTQRDKGTMLQGRDSPNEDKEVPDLADQLSKIKVPKTSLQAKSTFTKSRDKTMAARQTKIESLGPAERKEQDEWAQEQLQQNAGQCAAGFQWFRIQGGYRCHGGSHMVTDEILAEGKGGYYCRLRYGGDELMVRELGLKHFIRDSTHWGGPMYESLLAPLRAYGPAYPGYPAYGGYYGRFGGYGPSRFY